MAIPDPTATIKDAEKLTSAWARLVEALGALCRAYGDGQICALVSLVFIFCVTIVMLVLVCGYFYGDQLAGNVKSVKQYPWNKTKNVSIQPTTAARRGDLR